MKKFCMLFIAVMLSSGLALTKAYALVDTDKVEAYKFCQELEDNDFKPTCIKIVSGAISYERELVQYCRSFKYFQHKIYCIDSGRNSTFDAGALEACASIVKEGDEVGAEREQISCLKSVAKAPLKTVYSHSYRVRSGDQDSFYEAYTATEAWARRLCQGWDHYYFNTPDWRAKDCGVSIYVACTTYAYCSRRIPINAPTVSYPGILR